MLKQKLIAVLVLLGALAQLLFLYLFFDRNSPGFSSPAVMAGIAAVYGVVFIVASVGVLKASGNPGSADKGSALVTRLLLIPACALLVWTFLDATVTDYYQPLSLFDELIAVLATSWVLLILALACVCIFALHLPLPLLRRSLALSLVAVFGWPLAASLAFINQPGLGVAVAEPTELFVGGRGGYDIYRIPALLTIPAGSKLRSGETLHADRLLGFAEARRDGALDTGVIDLVMRHSDDYGHSWSEQRVVCKHELQGGRGKCGNATPLFDAERGMVVLGYNLSGLPGGVHGPRFHSTDITFSEDGGLNWEQPRTIADDNFILGPGHGIQKRLAPAKGRLLLPGYLESHAQVIYSDDGGSSWQRSEPLDTGNETELAEFHDGRVYMTTRHRAPIGRPPSPNGRLFSVSSDAGSSWSKSQVDTALATPVCQASVLSYNNTLLFSNPDHVKSRVNLQIKQSSDMGQSWARSIPVFSGPSGYSQLAADSRGDVHVMFENGAMAYSEKITIARIPASYLSAFPGTVQRRNLPE
jgi:sialidase-1